MTIRNELKAIGRQVQPIRDKTFGWSKEFYFDATFPVFPGHFPGHPVLPAVVQILLAELTLEEGRGVSSPIEELLQAKFTTPIIPPCLVLCTVTAGKDGRWRGILESDGKPCAHILWREDEKTAHIL